MLYQTSCLVSKRAWSCSRSIHFPGSGRLYHHEVSPRLGHVVENGLEVKVRLGTGRPFALKIHHAPKPEADSPIVIYIKWGISEHAGPSSGAKELSMGANAAVAELDFGNSLDYTYPLPIHTTLAGYDWVLKNLARRNNIQEKLWDKSPTYSKVGVCGELMGGSLAAMLALTECHGSAMAFGQRGISAAALGNPVVDWTGLFEIHTKSSARQSRSEIGSVDRSPARSSASPPQGLSFQGLRSIRDSLFKKAEAYHDPFASPLLFFRTPSSELPGQPSAISLDGSASRSESEEDFMQPVRKRRSHRKHPPTGSGLTLPHLRLEVGKDCVLKEQGTELVNLMRKSLGRSSDDMFDVHKQQPESRFELREKEGSGFWDKRDMLEIGQWFGKVLRRA